MRMYRIKHSFAFHRSFTFCDCARHLFNYQTAFYPYPYHSHSLLATVTSFHLPNPARHRLRGRHFYHSFSSFAGRQTDLNEKLQFRRPTSPSPSSTGIIRNPLYSRAFARSEYFSIFSSFLASILSSYGTVNSIKMKASDDDARTTSGLLPLSLSNWG